MAILINHTWFNKTRHILSYQRQLRHPVGRKGNPGAGKIVKDTLHSQCQESHKNTKLHHHNKYSADQAQIHTGSMIVISVYVGHYKIGLVDFVAHVLVVTLTLLASTVFSVSERSEYRLFLNKIITAKAFIFKYRLNFYHIKHFYF